MKKILNIFSIFLAVILVLSAVSCGDKSSQKITIDDNHIQKKEEKIPESDVYLVKDGTSPYIIVMPENPGGLIKTAVSELTEFFRQATGIELVAINDSKAEWKEDKHYISIGNNKLVKSSGIDTRYVELKDTGVRIVKKANSVFLTGGNDYGTLYAVYEFLNKQFGFESYYLDENYIERNVTDKKLLDFDYMYNPSITYSISSYGEAEKNNLYRRRLKMLNYSYEMFGYFYGDIHNSFKVLPFKTYMEKHPDWYYVPSEGDRPLQLCYSRDVEGMTDEILSKIIDLLSNDSTVKDISFTHEDGATWCDCKSCRAIKNQYGTDSATLIKFMNVLARKLNNWLDENQKGRKVTLTFFAYNLTTEPPVIKNEDGSYKPIDESVVLEENLHVMYAPISMSDFYDFSHKDNVQYGEYFKKWAAVASETYAWLYSAYYEDNLLPIYTFNGLQEQYRFLSENGVSAIYQEEQYNMPVATDWSRLKMYVESKLMWNVDINLEETIKDWFDNYFKDASRSMYELFTRQSRWYNYIMEKYNLNGNYTRYKEIIKDEKYWPYKEVQEWEKCIAKAREDIEHYKISDPALYRVLNERIDIESISIRYLNIKFYKKYMQDTEFALYLENMKNDCAKYDILYSTVSNNSLENYLNSLN